MAILHLVYNQRKTFQFHQKMTFNETTTSTFVILTIILTIILACIGISILIIQHLSMKPREICEEKCEPVILESGIRPQYYHSQPDFRFSQPDFFQLQTKPKQNRRSLESSNLYSGRQFHQNISRNHLNMIKDLTVHRSNSTFVYYV